MNRALPHLPPAPTCLARSQSRVAGFTLLEVLLAVVVFAVVLVAMHYVFHGALRLRNRTTASLEEAVPLQQALAVIQRDLANLASPGGTLAGPLQTAPTGTTATLLGRVAPDFYTTVGVLRDTDPWPEIQRVTYRLTSPTNDRPGLELFRSVNRNLLALVESTPDDQFLLGGVETVTFQYFDGTTWRYDWDSTGEMTADLTSGLPSAIKVEIVLTSALTNRAEPEPIELVVPVTVQADTDTATQASGGDS
ncbi:MAG: prepilin-type N-terminal cleavage/methylation domain-containing protein [Verrucomicrobiales bacterium]|nr:prepilin-type N-terminal cleavage/methylation domain-containing protein [Verrucomicrobiales bacterium]